MKHSVKTSLGACLFWVLDGQVNLLSPTNMDKCCFSRKHPADLIIVIVV